VSSPRYQVVAACVTNLPSPSASTVRPGQTTLVTVYQGQLLPDGVPEDKIRHLLESGMIAEVDG
jgi:hypothetical protein